MTNSSELAALTRIESGLEGLTGKPYWVDGDQVLSSGTVSVMLAPHPEVPESEQLAHLDIGFALNRERSESTLWDCSSGFGATRAQAVDSAVDAWLSSTARVALELLLHDGSFADHYSSIESGLTGRHTIHGPLLGWGIGEGPDLLQQWWLEHPLLPLLAPALTRSDWPVLAGLRIFFGSQGGQSIAEVKVNQAAIPAAADLLLQQPWPRFEKAAYVRSYLALIPEAAPQTSPRNDEAPSES